MRALLVLAIVGATILACMALGYARVNGGWPWFLTIPAAAVLGWSAAHASYHVGKS